MKNNSVITVKKGQEHRREFIKLFKELLGKYSNWQVWQDFISMAAAALSQPTNFRQDREAQYMNIISKYNKKEQELFPKMLAEIVLAFEQEKFADILGDMYMEMDLGNHWRGQFFTPYCVCRMMSEVTVGNIKPLIDEKGYISVNDSCCGAGATLIAFAESAYKQEVNFQQSVLFAAQDVDSVVAKMCYIQMSLLGMAGYVIIGNTITADVKNYDYWYTPMYFSDIWHWRRTFQKVCELTKETRPEPKQQVYDIVLNERDDGQLMLAV